MHTDENHEDVIVLGVASDETKGQNVYGQDASGGHLISMFGAIED